MFLLYLNLVSRYGFHRVEDLKLDCNGREKEKYSKYKIYKFTRMLEDLNINPIPIPKRDAEQLGKEKWVRNPINSQIYKTLM